MFYQQILWRIWKHFRVRIYCQVIKKKEIDSATNLFCKFFSNYLEQKYRTLANYFKLLLNLQTVVTNQNWFSGSVIGFDLKEVFQNAFYIEASTLSSHWKLLINIQDHIPYWSYGVLPKLLDFTIMTASFKLVLIG